MKATFEASKSQELLKAEREGVLSLWAESERKNLLS